MTTKYYCEKCQVDFIEQKLPNMNKRHPSCGSIARIIAFESGKKDK